MLGKADLLAAIAGSNRGICSDGAQKAAILAAAARLEERNPTAEPTAAAQKLEGDWRLLYTTSSELLGIDRFPLLSLGSIYQCIRTADAQLYNIAEIQSLPGLAGLVTVTAQFEVASAQRLRVNFQRAVFGLQGWVGYRTPSQWIETLAEGRRLTAVDLTLARREQSGWVDVTYLDDDMRINRGNAGSLFILQRA